MPSELALVLAFAFILFLFWGESLQRTKASGALWIPLIWLLITGSRFVSAWFDLHPASAAAAIEDASPIDAAVFLCLILAGIYVLRKRHVTLAKFVRNNRWVTIFLLFCLVSTLWSEFPFIAFKRWIKVLGHVTMVLIVLTDPDHLEAMRTLLKRTAFVLAPLSILLINCYPQWGQAFDPATGEVFYTGVTTNKNMLGQECMILGLFFFWNTLRALRRKTARARPGELFWSVVFLGMIWWLLRTAGSATSLACMFVGMLTIVLLRLPLVNKRFIGMYVLLGILALVVGEMVFGIYSNVVQLLGRDLSLTDRTDLWQTLLKLQPNPIFGAGFESFWLGGRLEQLWARYPWHPNEAHNGYFETYLNLGIVGIVLLTGLIIGTFWKIRRELLTRVEFGRFRLGFLFAILAYNFTEAAFINVTPLYTFFFLIAVDYPTVRRSRPRRFPEPLRSEAPEAAVSAGT
jgi:exopolysaccharide production protein ExoQ